MTKKSTKNQSILVVDDEPEILRMISRTLELEGFNVITAVNGSSALARLEQSRVDLIILDIIIPGLDGWQVLNLIRQRSRVPVIMLSARREVTTLCRALVLGADDYVTKPFRTQELVARIGAKLRRSGSGVTASNYARNSAPGQLTRKGECNE